MFLFAPLETCNSYELFNTSNLCSHKRISHDGLYNLHELAYNIPGFIHEINTFPDLTCVCGLKELFDEANKALMLNETQQLLSYDTTFQLGNLYVSLLLFHHTLFKERPCIPAIFLIHECNFAETHQIFFQEASLHTPFIQKSKACLVTDEERAIKKAVDIELLNLRRVQCWNHLFGDIQFWLHKNGVPASNITV